MYGLILKCGYSNFKLDDDCYIDNGFRRLAPSTGLLVEERRVIEYVKIFNQPLSLERKTDLRRIILRTRSYLQELELFSPKVDSNHVTTCLTCNLCDDGLIDGCRCRRVFVHTTFQPDFCLESLRKDWIYYHYSCVSPTVCVQLLKPVAEPFYFVANNIIALTLMIISYPNVVKLAYIYAGEWCQPRPPDVKGFDVFHVWHKIANQ